MMQEIKHTHKKNTKKAQTYGVLLKQGYLFIVFVEN